jgi:hypothetical protein
MYRDSSARIHVCLWEIPVCMLREHHRKLKDGDSPCFDTVEGQIPA